MSDDINHDKYSVAAFNRTILEKAMSSVPEKIEKLHIFSDGAGSQFKNRFTLSNILRPHIIHSELKEVDWSFFGTAHGKGPVDGVGGTVKRAVWRRILMRQVLVNSAKDFAEVATVACPNVHIVYVSAAEVDLVRQELDDLWKRAEPQNVQNIRQTHSSSDQNVK